MATDAAAVPPFTDVLAVAGTDHGADTAAIVVSTFVVCFLSLKPERRFQVKEILALLDRSHVPLLEFGANDQELPAET